MYTGLTCAPLSYGGLAATFQTEMQKLVQGREGRELKRPEGVWSTGKTGVVGEDNETTMFGKAVCLSGLIMN